jgi:spermidine/putrescine transport system ATP-binding protein
MMQHTEPSLAVELRDVTKTFGPTVALDGVSLGIRKGEFFSLLGPSGCGKTTTLNLIGGFETATRGAVLIDGRVVSDVPSHARPVNTVFQSYALFPHMSVAENVGFGLRMRKVPRPERARAVADMLQLVSLGGFEERRPGQLSGGQRQRVALARALINKPSVLLLDEPLGALDLKLRKQMQAELTRLQRQVGITFVYVTHDQDEALSMSDRIAVMDRGRVLQTGTPAEIYGDPADRFVMEFIGSPNVFAGRLEALAPEHATVELEGVGRVRARRADGIAVGTRVAVLVRPERIRMSVASPASGPGVAGRITKVADLGFVTHYFVRLADRQDALVYRLGDGAMVADRLEEGQQVHLTWDTADARLFPERMGA